MATALAAGTFATALAAGTFATGQLADAPVAQAAQSDIVQVSAAQRAADQQKLLDSINSYRRSLGLKPVRYSQTLTNIEQAHSDAQVRDESFYHTDQFMTDSRAGRWTHVNEVIALSYQSDVNQLLAWWKTSAAHNAAITSPKAEVIGIALTYADGSLQRTGQPWRLLGTVNLYGYANGGSPADATTTVAGGAVTVPAAQVQPQAAAAYSPYGAIGVTWRNFGGTAGFGTPVMAEAPAADGGRYQRFVKDGRYTKVMWSSSTGTHYIKEYGGIGATWSRAGYERGYGYPVTNEYRVGREMHQRFSGGYTIKWDSVTQRTWVEQS
ncbi:hypothetical protein SA13R_04680 [Rothia kristinae]|nr:hypothetical protein RSA5_07325 [Rothia kristinae]KTR60794.1 hypothetical protein SA11R_00910 [Rothia kristinae]KTR73142.1 hypothetical protein SA12R_00805 [Rothia kristinae]KTR74445.1 hypothetical protein SA15R_00585 [Rothia kristinae]KTR80376.1 hypothetical protein SA14R_01645 [Rothia kristinae]